MEKLDLTMCTTNSQVFEKIRDRVLSIPCEELVLEVEKTFIYMRPTIRALYIGMSTGLGIYISGPSGTGKSSIVKHILDFYGIPYYTISGYKDMPVDALLGVPNIRKFLKKSEYVIKFKKSVFALPGIFLGEEFSDIDASVASALKDIITEKGYRYKDTFTPSLISSMIVVANKKPEEIVDDESKRAFYIERFPVTADSSWENYNVFRYKKFIRFMFPDIRYLDSLFLAELFETNFIKHNNWISPRQIINLTKTYLSHGSSSFSSFNINIDDMTTIYKEAKITLDDTSFKEALDGIYNELSKAGNKKERINMLAFIRSNIGNIKTTDSSSEYFLKFKKKLDSIGGKVEEQKHYPEIQKYLKHLIW